MAKILTGTNDIEHSVRPYSNVPTEVCEKIIDMLYSFTVKDTTVNIATLHSCSLVCRNWRVSAQKTLFYKVQLSDGTALSRFSAVLDDGQHLLHYVHEVLLTGHEPIPLQYVVTLLTRACNVPVLVRKPTPAGPNNIATTDRWAGCLIWLI